MHVWWSELCESIHHIARYRPTARDEERLCAWQTHGAAGHITRERHSADRDACSANLRCSAS